MQAYKAKTPSTSSASDGWGDGSGEAGSWGASSNGSASGWGECTRLLQVDDAEKVFVPSDYPMSMSYRRGSQAPIGEWGTTPSGSPASAAQCFVSPASSTSGTADPKDVPC